MDNFNFLCEPDLLSDKQIQFICNVIKKCGFDNGTVSFENLGKAGDNYGSSVKRMIVKQSDGKAVKMIAKTALKSEFLRTTMAVDEFFGNEFLIYGKILPKFRQLEVDHNILEEDRIKTPFCYGILQEKFHEIMLLEDVTEIDYVMLDKFKALTDNEIRVILKEYAKFHSLSFVLKEKDYETYKELASGLTNVHTTPLFVKNVDKGFIQIEERVSMLLDTDKYKNTIRGSMKYIADEARKLESTDKDSKPTVIVHGDAWTNNIMFKLQDGVAHQCMLIDYQLSAQKSPVNDILYLIFCCTDYQTRSKHYNDWIDWYYESLEKNLSQFDVKAVTVYTKERLGADLKRYSRFYLGWSIFSTNLLSMTTEDSAKLQETIQSTESAEQIMDRINIENFDSDTVDKIKTKIQGVIESYYELGYSS